MVNFFTEWAESAQGIYFDESQLPARGHRTIGTICRASMFELEEQRVDVRIPPALSGVATEDHGRAGAQPGRDRPADAEGAFVVDGDGAAGDGVFARRLQQQFPHLPMEEVGRLNNNELRENFLTRVFAYDAWFRF